MSKRISTPIFSLILLAVITIMMITTLNMEGKQKNFPLLIGSITWVGLLTLTVIDIRKYRHAKTDTAESSIVDEDVDAVGPDSSSHFRWELLKVSVSIIAVTLLIYLVGFYLATIGFSILFFFIYKGTKWWQAALMAAGMCLTIYVLVTFVQMELYQGVLFGGRSLYW